MKYNGIVAGKFIRRDNRFIAQVEINGKTEICHVKNTGRCKELLVAGAEVYLEPSSNPKRKTKFSLIAVNKMGRLINMDSQAPNFVVEEAINEGWLFGNINLCKRECTFNNSRFDFYIEKGDEKIFAEVKGVTLENNNIVSFPDAPSQRAVKHIKELEKAIKSGYKSYIIFVVQMSNVDYFVPNESNHKEFAEALREASQKGVNIIALDCTVTCDSMILRNNRVEVRL